MRVLRYGFFLLLVLPGVNARAADDLPAANLPVSAVIDQVIQGAYREESVTPAAKLDDAALLRRVTLDLVGRIPTYAETKNYLADGAADKFPKLVDRLMQSPGFIRHQSNMFEAMLQTGLTGRNQSSGPLRDYLRRSLAENKPWDKIFRELLLPNEEDPKQAGASEFLKARVKDLDRLTNDVSVVFFGVNVSCAQCHDHPLVDDWKQDHFYGMKSFFQRTYESNGQVGEKEFGIVKYIPNKGKEKVAPMMFLTGKQVTDPNYREPTADELKREKKQIDDLKKAKKSPPPTANSARAKLVQIALEPGQNDFFAKALANRVWHRIMGYGLVNPLDQMHTENEPNQPALLKWLGRDLASHNYDWKRTLRGIVLSETYARSTVWDSQSAPPVADSFAVARLKPLTPLQFAAALRIATQDPLSWEKMKPEDAEKRLEQLENSAGGFARDLSPIADDFQVGVSEALLFSNGNEMKNLLHDGGDRLVGRLLQLKTVPEQVEMATMALFSRKPTADESKAIGDYLAKRGDRKAEAIKQVVWALLTSPEMRFNP